MNVHMAIADPGLDGGHLGVAHHRVDQPRSPARDDDVDQTTGLDQVRDARAILARQQLHGVSRQTLVTQRGLQPRDQRRVGVHRRRTAAQQHGIAGLERQPERVDRHVGPALVDDSDHAERNPLLTQLKPVGQGAAAQRLADGIGQPGDLSQAVGDAVDALWAEREAVEHRGGGAGLAGGVEIQGVGRQDVVRAGEQRVGGRMQRAVLGLGAQRCQFAGCDARPACGVVDLLAQVGNRRCLQTHRPSVSDLPAALDSCQMTRLPAFAHSGLPLV